jgi:hypothetical protein
MAAANQIAVVCTDGVPADDPRGDGLREIARALLHDEVLGGQPRSE